MLFPFRFGRSWWHSPSSALEPCAGFKRFVALADNKLCCWEERSDPRPGLTLDMAKTESVSRPNGVRECVAIKNDTYDNQWDDNDDDVDDDVLNLMFPTPEAGDSAYALLRYDPACAFSCEGRVDTDPLVPVAPQESRRSR